MVDVGTGGGVKRLLERQKSGGLDPFLRVISLTPELSPDDKIRNSKLPHPAEIARLSGCRLVRLNVALADFLTYRTGRTKVRDWISDREMACFGAAKYVSSANVTSIVFTGKEATGYLDSPVQFAFVFNHSAYYINAGELALMADDDLLFVIAHMFDGEKGEFPTATPLRRAEMSWTRTGEKIVMRPLEQCGTEYRHRDITRQLRHGWDLTAGEMFLLGDGSGNSFGVSDLPLGTVRGTISSGIFSEIAAPPGTGAANYTAVQRYITERLQAHSVAGAKYPNEEPAFTYVSVPLPPRATLAWIKFSEEKVASVQTGPLAFPAFEPVASLFRGVIVTNLPCPQSAEAASRPRQVKQDEFEAMCQLEGVTPTPEFKAAVMTYAVNYDVCASVKDDDESYARHTAALLSRYSAQIGLDAAKALKILREAVKATRAARTQLSFDDEPRYHYRQAMRRKFRYAVDEDGGMSTVAWMHRMADGMGIPGLHKLANSYRSYKVEGTSSKATN